MKGSDGGLQTSDDGGQQVGGSEIPNVEYCILIFDLIFI